MFSAELVYQSFYKVNINIIYLKLQNFKEFNLNY